MILRSTFAIQAGILIGISAFFSSCDRIALPWSAPSPAVEIATPFPGRNEVAVAGDFRLSMNGYEALKSMFPTLNAEDVAHLGLQSLWLQSVAAEDSKPSIEDAARCLRAFFSPALSASALNEADALARRFWGTTSLDILRKKRDDAWLKRPIEWNRALQIEYGIPSPERTRNSG